MSLVQAYIALGSNLGDHLGYLQSALDRLAVDAQLKVLQISPVYENRAVGMGEVDDFLNAIAEVETSVHPLNDIAPDLLIRGQRVGALAATLPKAGLTRHPGSLIA